MKKTKEALATLLKVGTKVAKAYDDGKIDMGEAIGISVSAVGMVSIFKNLPEIEAEIKAINVDGINELVAEFNADFDIPNDELEHKIKAGIGVLSQMIVMLLLKPTAA